MEVSTGRSCPRLCCKKESGAVRGRVVGRKRGEQLGRLTMMLIIR